MYSKVNYTIVGLFVLLFSVGLLVFGFWLAKYGLHETYHTYKIEMKDSIAGLSEDSSVKLHGVDVGRVSQIRINPNNIGYIDIYIKIKEDIPIKEDMVASTQMLGVTGLLTIEIHGGTNEAKTLKPTDDYIPLIPSRPSLLSKLTANVPKMSQKLVYLLEQSEKLFSDHNIETLSHIFENLEKTTLKAQELESEAIRALDEFKSAMRNMNAKFTQGTIDFKQMQKDFSAIKKVTVPTVNKLMQTSRNINRLTLTVEKSLNRGDYNLKKILEPMLIDIQILTGQLNVITKELGESPSDLLFKSRKLRKGPGE